MLTKKLLAVILKVSSAGQLRNLELDEVVSEDLRYILLS